VQFALGSVHPTHLSEEWESSNATWNQKGHTGWSVLQACQTTGLPVTLAPVGIAQGGRHHALAGGRMEKITVTHVDAYMAVTGAGAEEYQVAHLNLVTFDLFPALQKFGGGARHFHAQAGQEGEVDKTGTVNAARTQAAVAVGDAFPVLVLGFQ